MELQESKINPPRFPLTRAINQSIVDFYFDYFMGKNIPSGIAWVVTSRMRSKEKNKDVKGASNSAHLHGLAIDFILMRDNNPLSHSEQTSIWQKYVKPNWPGYTYSGEKHIHVNLSRKIGTAANLLAISVMGIVGVQLFTKFKKRK